MTRDPTHLAKTSQFVDPTQPVDGPTLAQLW